MPSADEIQSGLTGTWRLMLGKADGLRFLDLSADGFWNSFFAFVVALPALFAMWTAHVLEIAPMSGAFGLRVLLVIEFAIMEVAGWLLPLAAIAYGLIRMRLGDRLTPFVVANNWSLAIVSWIVLPPTVLPALFPSLVGLAQFVLLMVLFGLVVLLWRLNNAILNKGGGIAAAVVAALVFLPLPIYFLLEWLFGIPQPAFGPV